jgi:hypothetical protein
MKVVHRRSPCALRFILILFSHIRLYLPNVLSPSCFPTKYLCIYHSILHATYFFDLIFFGHDKSNEEIKSRSFSLCSLFFLYAYFCCVVIETYPLCLSCEWYTTYNKNFSSYQPCQLVKMRKKPTFRGTISVLVFRVLMTNDTIRHN